MNILTFFKMWIKDEKFNIFNLCKITAIVILSVVILSAIFVPSVYVLQEIYSDIPFFKLFSLHVEESINYEELFLATISSVPIFLLSVIGGFFVFTSLLTPPTIIIIAVFIVLHLIPAIIRFICNIPYYFYKKWNFYKNKLKDI